jgi:hypothetical protein
MQCTRDETSTSSADYWIHKHGLGVQRVCYREGTHFGVLVKSLCNLFVVCLLCGCGRSCSRLAKVAEHVV